MTQNPGPKCGAKRHGRDETCTLPAGWGTDHIGAGRCRKHLGNTPNVAKAARDEQANAMAREELAKLDVPPVDNPLYSLRKLAGQAEAWKDTCARLLNLLEPEQLRYLGTIRGEQLRGEVAMFQDSMRLSAQLLTSLARLDIDNRWTTLTDLDAQRIAAALAAALAVLDPAPDLAQRARAEFVRVLTSGMAPGRTRQAIAGSAGGGSGLPGAGAGYAADDEVLDGIVITRPR